MQICAYGSERAKWRMAFKVLKHTLFLVCIANFCNEV